MTLTALVDEDGHHMVALLALVSSTPPAPSLVIALVILNQILPFALDLGGSPGGCRWIWPRWLLWLLNLGSRDRGMVAVDNPIGTSKKSGLVPLRTPARLPAETADVAEVITTGAS